MSDAPSVPFKGAEEAEQTCRKHTDTKKRRRHISTGSCSRLMDKKTNNNNNKKTFLMMKNSCLSSDGKEGRKKYQREIAHERSFFFSITGRKKNF